MKTLLLTIWVLFSALVLTISCKQKNEITPANTTTKDTISATGNITIKTEGRFNDQNLALNKYYALNSNDSITISTFKFYISNIKIKNAVTGAWFSVPNSYYLFDQTKAGSGLNSFALANIPAGEYSEIMFYTGVDSITNSSEVIAYAIPALSPTNDMIWAWHTGYIFYKLEGDYKNANQTTKKGSYYYNVGSYSTLSKQSFLLTKNLIVNKKQTSQLLLHANAAKLFTGTNTIDVNETNTVDQTGDTYKLMQNYSAMYTITTE